MKILVTVRCSLVESKISGPAGDIGSLYRNARDMQRERKRKTPPDFRINRHGFYFLLSHPLRLLAALWQHKLMHLKHQPTQRTQTNTRHLTACLFTMFDIKAAIQLFRNIHPKNPMGKWRFWVYERCMIYRLRNIRYELEIPPKARPTNIF